MVTQTSSAAIPVRELNRIVRGTLESEFPLMWICGEVSNLVRATSGHVYFSLKDDAAQVRCVMFRTRAQAVSWRLENGQSVEALALVTLYEARGEFQLLIESLRRDGIGALFEAFARLKAKLLDAGLFAAERKRSVPRFPRTIGIVSSPRAAALADVIAALRRRAPQVQVVLYPSAVQGAAAANELRQAIESAGQRRECDVVLLVRGGGSVEDLWAFNDEALAHCIANSPVPVVTGIGHDTDTTIADFVSDLHAPTPTAAAEFVSQGWHEANDRIASLESTLRRGVDAPLAGAAQALDRLGMRLLHPSQRIRDTRSRLRIAASRLTAGAIRRIQEAQLAVQGLTLKVRMCTPQPPMLLAKSELHKATLRKSMCRRFEVQRAQLDRLAISLDLLNPVSTLARGYSVARDASGRLVSDAEQLEAGQTLSLQFAAGGAIVRVIEKVDEVALPLQSN